MSALTFGSKPMLPTGLLVSQFLTPCSNWRYDSYEGCPENKQRFLKEIVETVRDGCGKDFYIGAKLNATDALKRDGVEADDCEETIKDFELSTGFLFDGSENALPRPTSTERIAIIRKRVPNAKIALACGNVRSTKW